MGQRLYVGKYTVTGGISVFDWEDGVLSSLGESEHLENPSYLCEGKKALYAVAETTCYAGKNGGAVGAFDCRSKDLLVLTGVQNTLGKDPCHLVLSPDGRLLFAANYTEGSLSCFRINGDGSLGTLALHQYHHGHGPVAERQEQAHVHYLAFTPDSSYLCAVDLGMDQILVYQVIDQSDRISLKQVSSVSFVPGTGPRHLAFSKHGQDVYVIGELANTITHLRYLGHGKFKTLETTSTLPEKEKCFSTAAAVKLSPDGKYLYASNRGHDSIAVFEISQTDGSLTLMQHISSGGKTPRDIALSPDGNWLLSADQDSDCIAVFRRGHNGILQQYSVLEPIEKPVCLCFSQTV